MTATSPRPSEPTLAEAQAEAAGYVDDLRDRAWDHRRMAAGAPPGADLSVPDPSWVPPANAAELLKAAEAWDARAERIHKLEKLAAAVEPHDDVVKAVIVTRRGGVGAETILEALARLRSDAKANRGAHAKGRAVA